MRRSFSIITASCWSLSLAAAVGVAVGGCGTKQIDGIGPGSTTGTGDPLCADMNGNSSTGGGATTDPKIMGGGFFGTSPTFDGLVMATDPPPAISGGTLLVLRDGNSVVAADADRDRIYVVDVRNKKVQWSIPLMVHDQPGRVVQDGAGMVHVVLRGSGLLATVDAAAGRVTARRAVCTAPRGLAYDKVTDRLHVACAGGELVTFTPTGATPERTQKLWPDLRDVVVDGPRLMVTRFRSAQVMVLDSSGAMLEAITPASFSASDVRQGDQFSPAVAWRATALPDGGMVMSHQRGTDKQVGSTPGGYGGGFDPCGTIVHSTVTRVKAGERPVPGPAMPGFVLPVDIAVSPNGQRIAMVAAGNGHASSPEQAPKLFVTDMDDATNEWDERGCGMDGKHGPGPGFCGSGTGGTSGVIPPDAFVARNADGTCPAGLEPCGQMLCFNPMITKCDPALMPNGGTGGAVATGGSSGAGGVAGTGAASGQTDPSTGMGTGMPTTSTGGSTGSGPVQGCGMTVPGNVEPVSVGFVDDARVVVQTREPAALYLVTDAGSERIVLSQESRSDTGHIVFHSNSGGGLACASCHPEGHEDGRLWTFQCEGTRRTQDLSAGIADTKPFHWNGDLATFPDLVDTVFVRRMSGPTLTREQTAAALNWINAVPARAPMRPATDPAVARGKALFDSQAVGCATCHTGAMLTNNQNADVNTKGLFQVPSLRGLSTRAPYMHDGCAGTIAARFDDETCGGGELHGQTAHLTPAQKSDLIGYLESL